MLSFPFKYSPHLEQDFFPGPGFARIWAKPQDTRENMTDRPTSCDRLTEIHCGKHCSGLAILACSSYKCNLINHSVFLHDPPWCSLRAYSRTATRSQKWQPLLLQQTFSRIHFIINISTRSVSTAILAYCNLLDVVIVTTAISTCTLATASACFGAFFFLNKACCIFCFL